MQEDRPAKTVSTENRNRKEDVELHIQHTRTQLCATITRWTVIPKIHYTRFPVTSPYKGSCQLVASLLATSRCNGIWETTRHNRHNGLFARANLLRICYGETGVMDFGLIWEPFLLQPLVCGTVFHHTSLLPPLSIFCCRLKGLLQLRFGFDSTTNMFIFFAESRGVPANQKAEAGRAINVVQGPKAREGAHKSM